MNPALKGRDMRNAFDSEDYQVMIVANKFQTGFDQPKLCAMYVDKKLGGVECVQTLSRLNRIYPGKSGKRHLCTGFFLMIPKISLNPSSHIIRRRNWQTCLIRI